MTEAAKEPFKNAAVDPTVANGGYELVSWFKHAAVWLAAPVVKYLGLDGRIKEVIDQLDITDFNLQEGKDFFIDKTETGSILLGEKTPDGKIIVPASLVYAVQSLEPVGSVNALADAQKKAVLIAQYAAEHNLTSLEDILNFVTNPKEMAGSLLGYAFDKVTAPITGIKNRILGASDGQKLRSVAGTTSLKAGTLAEGFAPEELAPA